MTWNIKTIKISYEPTQVFIYINKTKSHHPTQKLNTWRPTLIQTKTGLRDCTVVQCLINRISAHKLSMHMNLPDQQASTTKTPNSTAPPLTYGLMPDKQDQCTKPTVPTYQTRCYVHSPTQTKFNSGTATSNQPVVLTHTIKPHTTDPTQRPMPTKRPCHQHHFILSPNPEP